MSSSVLDEVICPICIDTLTKPIRMLPCGHNLCQECVSGLCETSNQENCPACRKTFQLGSNGVESLPRNLVVENMIERLTIEDQPQGNETEETRVLERLSTFSIHQLQGLAASYMENNKYDDAIKILLDVISQQEGYHKIKPTIDIAKCYLEIGKLEKLKQSSNEIVSIVNLIEILPEVKEICPNCDVKIQELATTMIINKDYKTAIALAHCLVKIIDYFYDGNTKVEKLSATGALMQDIAKLMVAEKKEEEFKAELPFMDEILCKMQEEQGVEAGVKTLEIARLLKYIGFCCNVIKDYTRSVEVHEQAIAIMNTMFGEKAKDYALLGLCHDNLANIYKQLNRKTAAESSNVESKQIDLNRTAEDLPGRYSMRSRRRRALRNRDDLFSHLMLSAYLGPEH